MYRGRNRTLIFFQNLTSHEYARQAVGWAVATGIFTHPLPELGNEGLADIVQAGHHPGFLMIGVVAVQHPDAGIVRN